MKRDLPLELLQRILLFADVSTTGALRLTCKAIDDSIICRPALLYHMTILRKKLFKFFDDARLSLLLLGRHAHFIKAAPVETELLEIWFPKASDVSTENIQLLRDFDKAGGRLLHIHLWSSAAAFIQHLAGLKCVEELLLDDGVVVDALPYMPGLTHLRLRGGKTILGELPIGLTKLTIKCSREVSRMTPIALATIQHIDLTTYYDESYLIRLFSEHELPALRTLKAELSGTRPIRLPSSEVWPPSLRALDLKANKIGGPLHFPRALQFLTLEVDNLESDLPPLNLHELQDLQEVTVTIYDRKEANPIDLRGLHAGVALILRAPYILSLSSINWPLHLRYLEIQAENIATVAASTSFPNIASGRPLFYKIHHSWSDEILEQMNLEYKTIALPFYSNIFFAASHP